MGKWESGNYIASIIHTYIVKKLDHMRIRPSILKPSITLCLAHTSLCVQLILSRLFRPSNTVFSLLITVCSASNLQCVLAQPSHCGSITVCSLIHHCVLSLPLTQCSNRLSQCFQPIIHSAFSQLITVCSARQAQVCV
jgi:hypothetical protein